MPTLVKIAKQCLNPEASHALDEAVSLTCRRGHSQTTSLHVVSSLICLNHSQLKQACIRARNAGFCNPKVQLKALEFCLSVSLDRLPVSHKVCLDETHVSNSLMAAIKRSQANQRRHPDCIVTVKSDRYQNFGGISSCSSVKVDLQHLIVSILDDPIISRVFNDAGFSSFDVKMAVSRPFQGLYRYPDPGFRRVRVPFSGSCDEEGEYKRVVELLGRKKGRNPLLVGVCANEVVKGFVEVLERRKEGILPMEICGINVVSIEEDMGKVSTAKLRYDAVEWRFKELGLMVEQCIGPGLMVNVGDLRCFLGKQEKEVEMDAVNCVVKKLTKLLEVHGGRVWLIGFVDNDDTYMEFLSRFPLIDQDWDLQPLPITSIKSSMGESCFKSSLMRSFVPFGGFFSTPALKGPFSSSCQYDARCSVFDGKLPQDATAVSKRVLVGSVADLGSGGSSSAIDHPKAERGAMLLSGTVTDLQRGSRNVCQSQSQNHNMTSTKPDSFQPPTNVGCHWPEQKAKTLNNECNCTSGDCGNKYDRGILNACSYMDDRKQLTSWSNKQTHLGSLTNDKFLAKLSGSPSKNEHPYNLCISSVNDSQTSSSGVSVVMDLGWDLFPQVSRQEKNSHVDVGDGCHLGKSFCSSSLNLDGHSANNLKTLFGALFERVGRQSEALGVISQIVAQSWISNGNHQKAGLRGDIWMNFIGPDIFGKRKTALALTEILYGSNRYFIHVNFCSQDVNVYQEKVFGFQITNGSDARSRGKTVVDHIAEELRKMPFSVVLLENVEFVDPVAQKSLLQAMRYGKFSDSYGREVSLTNRVFVLTSRLVEKNISTSMAKPSNFSEQRMEDVKGWPLQLSIRDAREYKPHQNSFILGPENLIHSQNFLCKRKFSTHETVRPKLHKGPTLSLDLNLPAEIPDEDQTEVLSWLDEFSNQTVTNTLVKVVFNRYDYDALAEKLLTLVHASFSKITNSDCLLEIEPRVMDQIMATACLSKSDKEIEDWIDRVLSRSFVEAKKICHLTSHSVVTLSTCDGEGFSTDGHVEGVYLPSEISVN